MKKTKTGKNFELQNYKNIISLFGSINYLNPKSIFIRFQCWVKPVKETEDWNKIILRMRREIKLYLMDNLDKELFLRTTIVDLSLHENGIGIRDDKASFLSCEITLFPAKHLDVKKPRFTFLMQELSNEIIDNLPTLFEYFSVTPKKTKKAKAENIYVSNDKNNHRQPHNPNWGAVNWRSI